MLNNDVDHVPCSPELTASVSGVELTYQTFGDPADPTMLLIMGLGGPMTWWDPDLCRLLAFTGHHVVRYDNRDTGRSTKVTGFVRRGDVVAAFTRPQRARPTYSMRDLAGDAIGLLDHLDVDRADVVGVSMGGMIAQTAAIAAPERFATMTSIMSTVGRRTVGWQNPKLAPMLLGPRERSRNAYMRMSARTWKIIGSPRYPTPREERERRAAETWDRGYSASGVLRQTMAVLTQPDRTPALRNLQLPTLVIHGRNDPLVHASGGKATARAIPGSTLMIIDGMGHDLPRQLFTTFAGAITGHTQRTT